MNREDVAMDVTVQNVEILRGRLEQAELALQAIAYLPIAEQDDMPAANMRVIAKQFLASQQVEIVPGHGEHLLPSWRNGQIQGEPHVLDFCPPKHPEQAEGAQGEREAARKSLSPENQRVVPVEPLLAEPHPLAALAQPSPEPCPCQFGNCMGADTEQQCKAQPSPAPQLCQHCFGHGLNDPAGSEPCPLCKAPELERPEVVGYLLAKGNGTLSIIRAGSSDEPVMTIAQHAAIVAKWAELLNRANDRADAAQARVAELESQLLDASAERNAMQRQRDNERSMFERECDDADELIRLMGLDPEQFRTDGGSINLPKLRAAIAPVAQAGHAKKWTYASEQETNCAGCGVRKHTPLRIDWMGGYVCLTCIDEKLEELYEALPDAQAGQAPEGWKLVPTEPTEEMKIAGWKAADEAAGCFNHEHGDVCPHCGDGFGQPDGCGRVAVKAFKAMLAAAPAQGGRDA